MRHSQRIVSASLAAWLLACGGSPPPAEPAPAPAEPVEVEAPAEAPPGGVGAACEGPPMTPSTCDEGMVCGFGPGGYCTAVCFGGSACPGDGVCTSTVRAGRLCMARCQTDADCRVEQGYVCDPGWRTCFLPGFHVPRLPACDGELPARDDAWSAPAIVSTGEASGRYSIEPSAALAADGSLVIAYMAMGTIFEPSRIATVVVDREGRASDPVAIETGRVQHFDPWIAAGPDGTLHLVWLGHDGRGDQNAQIGYASSRDGRAWSAPRAIHDADVDCPGAEPGCLDKPMIAVAPRGAAHAGRIYVAYFGMGDGGSLRMITSDDGGQTFGDSVRVGADAYGDLEVDARGRVHVTFAGGEGDRLGDPSNAVYYVVSEDGGATFSEPVEVSGDDDGVPFYFSNPTFAIDPRGTHRYVAYPAGTPDGRWALHLATSQDGRTWTRITLGGAPCPNRMTPTLAVERSGRVHLVWNEGGAGAGSFAYVACARGGARCDAPRRISDAPFADYQLIRHDASWMGEYDALVLDGRTLHAVWEQPVAGDPPVARVHWSRRRL